MGFGKLSSALGLLLVTAACTTSSAQGTGEEIAPSPSASVPVPPFRKGNLPVGPSLAIEPGQGVGPIRFGATVATIERLMQHRCEVLSDNLCRYVTRGVDFHLVNGELARVHVQRAERPAGRDAQGNPVEFGFFNGGIRPDLALGMKPRAMQEYLGRPERIEQVPEPNPQNMVARDYYPGLIIEYDRYKNGNVIFAGAIVFKDRRVDEALAREAAKPKPPPPVSSAPPPIVKPDVLH